PGGAETQVLESTEAVEESGSSGRRIIVAEDEEYEDEYDEELEEEPAEVPPAEPKPPGRTSELLDRIGLPGKQLALLAAAAVVGCLLVSLLRRGQWFLPEPEVGKIGPRGEQGLPGKTGFRGKRGRRGHEGTPGPQGVEGPRGADGEATLEEY
ncbi:MAG: hypothetical protein LC118_00630, partial [Dehalococcoidia bacterium]|nr:hypothetical protein [Dehalococcoidia bacterium]